MNAHTGSRIVYAFQTPPETETRLVWARRVYDDAGVLVSEVRHTGMALQFDPPEDVTEEQWDDAILDDTTHNLGGQWLLAGVRDSEGTAYGDRFTLVVGRGEYVLDPSVTCDA